MLGMGRWQDGLVMTIFLGGSTATEVNDYVIGRKRIKQAEDRNPPPDDIGGSKENGSSDTTEGRPNRGTLILDATCVPQSIRFPTDVSLLNEGRELLEQMIDTAHEAGTTEGRKPRTYHNNARRDRLRFTRDQKPTRKKIHKAIRQQLGYVRRDLAYLEKILREHPEALSAKDLGYLAVLQAMYEQQKHMYETKTHKVENRIVNLHQPWVQPIVRGKTEVPVEFGANVFMSLTDGYARIEELS